MKKELWTESEPDFYQAQHTRQVTCWASGSSSKKKKTNPKKQTLGNILRNLELDFGPKQLCAGSYLPAIIVIEP